MERHARQFGCGRDNRLEDLRLLCPNCHSHTRNFAGRNGSGANAAA
jgi:Zn finger protein HypA/HybF involved in hydrogenase expression